MRKKQHIKSVSYRMPLSLVELLTAKAAESGRPISGLVREAIMLGLEDMDKDPDRAKAARLAIIGQDRDFQ